MGPRGQNARVRTFEDRLLLVLTAYSLLILFTTPIPPMTDLPTHLASAAVLRDFDGSPLREAFDVRGWLNSNRLFAFAAGHTPRFLPMTWIGKAGLSLWLLLPLIARRYLATWRPGAAPWASLACLLSFSSLFNCGYVPYLIGVPLAALAIALPWAAQQSPRWRSLVLPAGLLTLAVYAHVLAFLAGAFAVAATCVAVRSSLRSWLSRALVLLPSSVLCLAIYLENRGPAGLDIAPIKPDWTFARRLFEKAISIADVFISFRVREEVLLFGIPLAVVCMLGVLGLISRKDRPRRGPALMGILMTGLVLCFSNYFLGAERTDGRIIPVALITGLGLLPVWSGRGRVTARRALLIVLVVPTLLWAHWNYARASTALESAYRALLSVPPGQIAQLEFAEDPLSGVERLAPYRHLQGYYIVERHGFAPGVLFAHGETRWHPVSQVARREWRRVGELAGAETYVVIVGAQSIRGRLTREDRLFDDGRTIVVRERAALLLGDSIRLIDQLNPTRPSDASVRLPLIGVERPGE